LLAQFPSGSLHEVQKIAGGFVDGNGRDKPGSIELLPDFALARI
jgi:hypothetical protein